VMMTERPVKSKRSFMVLPQWIKRTHAHSAPSLLARAGSSKPGMTYHRPLLRAFDLDL
jgi:hypothetical protein